MSQDNVYEVEDGRKIINVTNAGVSVAVETTEQAAKGRQADVAAEMDAIKLACMRQGVKSKTVTNPGPIIR